MNEYKNGELRVVWNPEKCIHSGNCVKGLPQVFRPDQKPWIDANAASVKELKDQIGKCPSGALSYYMKEGADAGATGAAIPDITEIKVLQKGPLVVNASCKIIHKDGREEIRQNRVSFCRCGQSSNKPFCDGTHRDSDFDD